MTAAARPKNPGHIRQQWARGRKAWRKVTWLPVDEYVLEGEASPVFVDVLDALEAGRVSGRRVLRRSDGAPLTMVPREEDE